MLIARVFFALLITACSSVALVAKAEAIAFNNFSNSVLLERQPDGLYRKQGSALKVQLAPRLIIKTARDFTAANLALLAPEATHITDLFLLKQQRYFLMHFAQQTQALEALKQLQQQAAILLVQPDLQQQRTATEKSPGSFERATTRLLLPDYLLRVQKRGLWPGRAGEGVRVAIIDDGFSLRHPEFAQLQTNLNYDFSSKQLLTPSMVQSEKFGRHGTKIAGILFAMHNQQLPEGLVPKATFLGIRQSDTWTSQTLQSFYIAYLARADVINCSWHSQWLLEPLEDVVKELSRYGRAGKGTAVVFAAGNKGTLLLRDTHEASIASAIVVGANDVNGVPLPISNFGETVDVWNVGEKIMSTDANGSYSYFSGTSLAAAITTGYVALLIDADHSIDLAKIQKQLIDLME